jgi:7-carboxy-7-deazaguanine synthase
MEQTYRVNDIFYSLQGEGHNTGRAAVFVRFSGCNLRCPFCDTDFSRYETMTAQEIIRHMLALIPQDNEKPIVVLTGGEPTLQVDSALLDAIHAAFPFIAMESNGTKEPPAELDWLTVSPKEKVTVRRCNELKVLFNGVDEPDNRGIQADYYYLQPLDTEDTTMNQKILEGCVTYIKAHPRWRLSLQTHKLIGIK